MKKINLILLALTVSFCISCSKEKISSSDTLNSDELKIQELVNKYHLQIVKNDGTIPNESFKTLDEFEQYLKSHSQKVTASNAPSTTLKVASTSSTSKMIILNDGGNGSSTWYFGGGANRSEIYFPTLDGSGYQAYVALGWQSSGWAESLLHDAYNNYSGTGYSGGNSYTWSQTQTSGTANASTVTTAGTYTVTYNIGGVYYTYNYIYNLNGSWYSDGTIYATLSYQ